MTIRPTPTPAEILVIIKKLRERAAQLTDRGKGERALTLLKTATKLKRIASSVGY